MGEREGKGGRFGRGTFLKGAGAVLILAVAGGVWRAEERGVFGPGSGHAFRPWEDWRAETERGPLALVSAAILASNAHNTQPWLFKVAGSRVDLFADEGRSIGTIDPFRREMYMSLGCALENLLLAARSGGYRYRLALAPDSSDPTHAATVELFSGEKEASPLYDEIPTRHTNRYPYDTSRPVPPETLSDLGELNDESDVDVFWFVSGDQRDEVGGLLESAAEAINAKEEQSYDNSLRWLRQDRDAIQSHRDGLTLDTMGLSGPTLAAAKVLPTLLSRARAKPGSLRSATRPGAREPSASSPSATTTTRPRGCGPAGSGSGCISGSPPTDSPPSR